MPRFVQHAHLNDDPHRFEVYDLSARGEDLIEELAADVRALYLDDDFDDVMAAAGRELDGVCDPDALQALIDGSVKATIPEPAQRTSQPWLDTARNELGEILCYAALEEIMLASIPAKRVRHKESPGLMSRGMDAVGLGLDQNALHGLRLFLSETKSSSSADNPPNVVDVNEDSLHTQLLAALEMRSRVAAELSRALKYTEGAEREIVARALLLWGLEQLATTVVPFLVRPEEVYAETDFGKFVTAKSDFEPAHIAFLIVRLQTTIEALSQAVYAKARA